MKTSTAHKLDIEELPGIAFTEASPVLLHLVSAATQCYTESCNHTGTYEEIVTEHIPFLRARALAMTRNREDAEDIAQDKKVHEGGVGPLGVGCRLFDDDLALLVLSLSHSGVDIHNNKAHGRGLRFVSLLGADRSRFQS